MSSCRLRAVASAPPTHAAKLAAPVGLQFAAPPSRLAGTQAAGSMLKRRPRALERRANGLDPVRA
ncbi:hypothetical protein OH76DRAFT_1410132 [Lentinus brumalis]|uniref:Uncharacterized protein n=1 Tax=Lentinus brumalis TaxID=2498619 RepID=A0A371CT57_9APHY|nr:hypothetical protein OH76DRAFT_1410132 [Polyporus brumalis]